MPENIYIAWATPVSPAAAAASLVAYASTKAALTTFRLCARSQGAYPVPLSRLSPEILLSIEDYVFIPRRNEELLRWDPLFDCLTDECIPHFHMTAEEEEVLRDEAFDAFEPFFEPPPDAESGDELDDKFAEDFDEFFIDYVTENYDDWPEKHQECVDELYDSLVPYTSSRLTNSQKVFATDFGLKIHFDVLPKYEGNIASYQGYDDPRLVYAKVAAYLILPRCEFAIDNESGPNKAAFSLAKMINPSVLAPFLEIERDLFGTALRTLRLTPTDMYIRKEAPAEKQSGDIDKKGPGAHEGLESSSTTLTTSKHDKWPALMMLGSGELSAFPEYDGER